MPALRSPQTDTAELAAIPFYEALGEGTEFPALLTR